jgi:hypothetical protein
MLNACKLLISKRMLGIRRINLVLSEKLIQSEIYTPKNWKPVSRFPPLRNLANAVDHCLHVVNTAAKNTLNKLKARKPSPTHIGIAVWLMSSCNVHHESTVSLAGHRGTVALHIFLLLTIVLGNRNLAMPVTSLTNLPLSPNSYHESTEPRHWEPGYHCTAKLP